LINAGFDHLKNVEDLGPERFDLGRETVLEREHAEEYQRGNDVRKGFSHGGIIRRISTRDKHFYDSKRSSLPTAIF
jgi:hypothetical protein